MRQISNKELQKLDRLAAEKVMGWQLVPSGLWKETYYYDWSSARQFIRTSSKPVSLWTPTTNGDCAFRVLEKLLDRDERVVFMRGQAGKRAVGIMLDLKPRSVVLEKSPLVGVCRLALAVYSGRMNKVGEALGVV